MFSLAVSGLHVFKIDFLVFFRRFVVVGGPCDNAFAPHEPPRALDVQRILTNGSAATRMRSNGSELEVFHVTRVSGDCEREADESF